DMTGTPRDDIQAELDSMRGGQNIDLELERLKGEIGAGNAQAIEGGTPAPDGAARPAQAERPQAGDGARASGSWARASGTSTMRAPASATPWMRPWRRP